jgi:hypothetical protein
MDAVHHLGTLSVFHRGVQRLGTAAVSCMMRCFSTGADGWSAVIDGRSSLLAVRSFAAFALRLRDGSARAAIYY